MSLGIGIDVGSDIALANTAFARPVVAILWIARDGTAGATITGCTEARPSRKFRRSSDSPHDVAYMPLEHFRKS